MGQALQQLVSCHSMPAPSSAFFSRRVGVVVVGRRKSASFCGTDYTKGIGRRGNPGNEVIPLRYRGLHAGAEFPQGPSQTFMRHEYSVLLWSQRELALLSE